MTKRARPVVGEVMTNAQLRETWTEAQFQSAVIGLLKEFEWSYYHTGVSIGSRPGYPDIHAWNPKRGRHFYAELKSQKGTATPAQARTLLELAESGHETHLWRPSDWDELTDLIVGLPA